MLNRRSLGLAAPFVSKAALAQGKRLRWAHVHEANEAYFTEAAWFRTRGKTVQQPDRAACVPLHNENVGWTRAQYDRLQAH